jgi:Holliday junction resolvase RusA-like endonuclease
MKQPISFYVHGVPRAKQSFRALRRGGGFTPAQVKAWQEEVAWAGQQCMRKLGLIEPIKGNLTVELVFFLPSARRIDLDNLAKCVQDGLNGVVWQDDQHNVRLVLDKYICRQRQGVLIHITENDRDLEISLKTMENIIYFCAPGYAVIATSGVTV